MTRINRLVLLGLKVDTTDMNNFKKVWQRALAEPYVMLAHAGRGRGFHRRHRPTSRRSDATIASRVPLSHPTFVPFPFHFVVRDVHACVYLQALDGSRADREVDEVCGSDLLCRQAEELRPRAQDRARRRVSGEN